MKINSSQKSLSYGSRRDFLGELSIIIFAFVIATSTSLVPLKSALAVSAWDDSIITTSTLTLQSYNTTVSEDVAHTSAPGKSSGQKELAFDMNLAAPNKMTPEQSKQIQQSHQIIAWLVPILAAAMALGLAVTTFLIVRKKKNRK